MNQQRQSLLPDAPKKTEATLGDVHGAIVYATGDDTTAVTTFTKQNAHVFPSMFVTHRDADQLVEQAQLTRVFAQVAYDYFTKVIQPVLDLPQTLVSTLYNQIFKPFLLPTDHHSFSALAPEIRTMAWHPHRNMLAVAHRKSTVYIFSFNEQEQKWESSYISDPRMKNITSLEWKPRAAGLLAVGCKYGVCVWHLAGTKEAHGALGFAGFERHAIHRVGGASDKAQDNLAFMQFLSTPDFSHISAIAWDPTLTSQVIAVASGTDNTVLLYDLLSDTTVPLKRHGKPNVLMRWSPDGQWLFVAAMGGEARLWDTDNWTSKRILEPSGFYVKSACWTPDSSNLYYTINKKDQVHVLFKSHDNAESFLETIALKVPSETVQSISGDKYTVGGPIKEIAIDHKKGSRLAISFEYCNLVALYDAKRMWANPLNSDMKPLIPIGYIRGMHTSESGDRTPKDIKPLHMKFAPAATGAGVVLAIARENDEITFTTHVI